MGFKSGLRAFCKKNAVLSRQYDKLTWYKSKLLATFIPDTLFAKIYYKRRTGEALNLKNPKTFDEKLWYLKLHNRDPLLTICSDKYRVREYVKQCGFEEILNELYGAYDDARDIPFDSFTEPVFLKCNHGSGENIIYYPDKPFDREDFIKRFNFDLKQNYYFKSREWNYKNIRPKIIAERVLRDKNGDLPIDYKFFCFHGIPKFVFINKGVATETGCHATDDVWNIFDLDMNPLSFSLRIESDKSFNPPKPKNYEEMIEVAKKLSGNFPCCRVDLYNVDGKIFFGECTFYHCGGCTNTKPEEWAYRLGSWIDLNEIEDGRV